MSFHLTLILVPLYLVLGYVATTWIRARHGYPLAGGAGRRDERTDERDALVDRLEARVRVLERIVTDRPGELDAEIEVLRKGSAR